MTLSMIDLISDELGRYGLDQSYSDAGWPSSSQAALEEPRSYIEANLPEDLLRLLGTSALISMSYFAGEYNSRRNLGEFWRTLAASNSERELKEYGSWAYNHQDNDLEYNLVESWAWQGLTLVTWIIRAFRGVFEECASNSTEGAGTIPSLPAPTKSFISSTDTSASLNRDAKRRRRDDDDSSMGENNDGFPNRSKIASDRSGAPEAVKFACPFRKHDPRTYDMYEWRSCALSHWDTVARIKEHLYRRHRAPIYCARCLQLFKTQEELLVHHTTVDACKLKQGRRPEGITSEVERILRSRKKSRSNQSEEERWKDIYRVLFPNDTVPDPYFEPVQDDAAQSSDWRDLASCEMYVRRELPRVFRSSLEAVVNERSQPLEEDLRSRLVNVIEDCQERVFSDFRSRLTPSRSVSMTPMPTAPYMTPSSLIHEQQLTSLGTATFEGFWSTEFQLPTRRSATQHQADPETMISDPFDFHFLTESSSDMQGLLSTGSPSTNDFSAIPYLQDGMSWDGLDSSEQSSDLKSREDHLAHCIANSPPREFSPN